MQSKVNPIKRHITQLCLSYLEELQKARSSLETLTKSYLFFLILADILEIVPTMDNLMHSFYFSEKKDHNKFSNKLLWANYDIYFPAEYLWALSKKFRDREWSFISNIF